MPLGLGLNSTLPWAAGRAGPQGRAPATSGSRKECLCPGIADPVLSRAPAHAVCLCLLSAAPGPQDGERGPRHATRGALPASPETCPFASPFCPRCSLW